jgi:N-acyl-L-homoserine lactone synthetase
MGLEFKIAETTEEKINCFKVRYKAYLDIGYIKKEDYKKEMIIDEYDSISTIFAAVKNKAEIIGTVRLTPPSELGFQMEELFDLTELKKKSKILWESSKVMALPEGKFKAILGLANLAYLFMKEKEITDLCYMASPEHAQMYSKLGIYPFAEQKIHPHVHNLAVPLHWEINKTTEKYKLIFEKGENVKL